MTSAVDLEAVLRLLSLLCVGMEQKTEHNVWRFSLEWSRIRYTIELPKTAE